MNSLHLLFVYNANSDLFSSVTDFVHKIISPKTYDCHLCLLIYGNLTMKQEWKSSIEKLPAEKTFLHKDAFQKQYGLPVALPAVFYLKEMVPVLLLSAEEIDACATLHELIAALHLKIEMLQHIPV